MCINFWEHALKTGHYPCTSLSHRYRGNFLQCRVHMKADRLRKPLRALRKDSHPPPLEGLDACRTLGQSSSDMTGNSFLGGESKLRLKRYQAAG